MMLYWRGERTRATILERIKLIRGSGSAWISIKTAQCDLLEFRWERYGRHLSAIPVLMRHANRRHLMDEHTEGGITGPMIRQAAEELIAKCELALVDPDQYKAQVCKWGDVYWDHVKHIATEIINGRK